MATTPVTYGSARLIFHKRSLLSLALKFLTTTLKAFQLFAVSNFFLLCRKGLHQLIASKSETSSTELTNKANGVFDVANLVLRLLPSRDGVVLRRLLMTAVSAITRTLFPSIYHILLEAMNFSPCHCKYHFDIETLHSL